MVNDFAALGQPYTKANEGLRLAAYTDTRGFSTIGFGHAGSDVHPGLVWTQEQADAAFATDYARATGDAQNCVSLDCWNAMGVARQAALVDMAFQLGFRGLRQFVSMRRSLEDQRWSDAADDALESLAARQTPNRWERHAEILREGDDAVVDGALPT